MSAAPVLAIGLLFGLRHAVDPDHVVVVAQMLEQRGAVRAALKVATLWGLGHCVSFLGVGLSLVGFGLHVPVALDGAVELVVASMLVGLGGWHLRRLVRSFRGKAVPPVGTSALRPLFVGLIHGLAGSASVAFLTLITIESRVTALAYLALFAIGTVLGMALLTTTVAWSLRRLDGRARGVTRAFSGIASAASVVLGIGIAVRVIA